MIIYCLTNKLNGKRYVGQTCDTAKVRWKEHVSAAKRGAGCRVLGAAIRKHGADQFSLELLETVATQAEADAAEAHWISKKQSVSPSGYNLASGGGGNGQHHEDSKRLIGEASKRRLRAMTPEQRAAYFSSNIHVWTRERKERARARTRTTKVRESVSSAQRALWSKLSAEERSARVRHQLAGVPAERLSSRVRKAWANMTPEAREARVRKARAANVASDKIRSKKMSSWQKEQATLRTPEQRSEIVKKAWVTRRKKLEEQRSV